MRFKIFSDESGIHHGPPCYAIGALVLSDGQLTTFERQVGDIIRKHQFDKDEFAWNYIGQQGTHHEASLDVMDLIVRHRYRFHAIIVKKDIYDYFKTDGFEAAFYRTYRLLFKHIARNQPGQYEAIIDDRDDHYKRHPETIVTITNNMLADIAAHAKFTSVKKAKSIDNLGIQVADLLTGAIYSSTANRLDSSMSMNNAKRDLIHRFASVLGWPDLAGDTYPQERLFNIWHFPGNPAGFRGWPQSRTIRRPLPALSGPQRQSPKGEKARTGRP